MGERTIMVNKGFLADKKYFLASFLTLPLVCLSVFSKLHFLGLTLFYTILF